MVSLIKIQTKRNVVWASYEIFNLLNVVKNRLVKMGQFAIRRNDASNVYVFVYVSTLMSQSKKIAYMLNDTRIICATGPFKTVIIDHCSFGQ